jgi:hypothetical protein
MPSPTDLLRTLHGAWARHGNDLGPSHRNPAELDDGVFRLEGTPRQLVGLGDAQDLPHTGQDLHQPWIDGLLGRPDGPQNRIVDPTRAVNVVPVIDEGLDNLLHLLVARRVLHHDDHAR